MPFINIRWADNTATLKANLAQGLQQIEATRASAEKMAQSLGGQNIIAAAHKYAAAVELIGGAAKLTAANQERVNAVMTKAVDVLNAAGKGGSDLAKHFQSLADQTKHAEAAHASWLKTLVEGVAIGELAAHGIEKLGELALEAAHRLLELPGEILKLADTGAKVAAIEKNFERLTEQAGLLGSELLGTLRAGTHQTISDFDLMTRVNQDLAAGLKLTDQQFGTLANGAFALSKATGIDVKQALDTMNDALLTGRTRSLALLTGKISLTKAEEDFAKGLLTTADHLTDEGKLEAARAAILKAVGAATERLGEQTDDLNTRLQQMRAAWANFEEDLGKTIATSQVLEIGMEGLKDILIETFGGRQQTLIEAIGNAIEAAEITLVRFGQTGVAVGGAIAKEFIAVEKIIGDVEQLLGSAHLLSLLAQRAVLTGTVGEKSPAELAALNANAVALNQQIAAIKNRSAALKQLDQDQKDIDASTETLTKRLAELQVKMEATRKATVDFVGPLQEEAAAHGQAAAATADEARLLQQSAAEKSKAKAAAEKLAEVERELASLNADYRETLKGIQPELIAEIQGWLKAGATIDQLTVKYPQLTKAQLKAVGELDKALDETLKSMDRFEDIGVAAAQAVGKSFAGMPKVLREISQSLGDVTLDSKTLPVTGALIGTTFEQSAAKIRSAMTASAQSVLSLNQEQRTTIDLMVKLGFTTEEIARTMGVSIDQVKTHVFSLGSSIKTTLEGIPDLLIQALTGGGGISGAFKALGVQLGREFAEGIQEGIKKAQASQKSGGSAINATTNVGGAGAGALAGVGAEAAGASGGRSAGAVGLTAASIGAQVGLQTGSIAAGAAAGAATAGIGLAVVAAIEIYKAKHKAQWEKLGIDIGNAFGVNLSKETLKAWEQESKTFGRQATGLLHLDEIIEAAGGIAKFGFAKAAQGAHDLFSLVQTGQLSVAQATKELDKLWPMLLKGGTDAYGRISEKLKELIKLNQQYGTESEAIAQFQQGQASTVVGGVNATVDTLGTADIDGTTFEAIGKRVTDAKKAVEDLTKAGKQGTEEWKKATEELAAAQKRQGEYAVANKQTLDDLADQALTAFAAAKATGATDAAALAAISPALKTLRDSYKSLGLDIEDVGVKALVMEDAVLNGPEKLGAGVAGLDAQIVALDNLNLLTIERFESLERTGSKMFDRLKAKAIESGAATEEVNKVALAPMQQFLHEAEDAAAKYGFKLDDATQALIDLSKAEGVWKASDPTDTLEGGIKSLIDSVHELIDALRGIPPKVKSDVDVDVNYRGAKLPPGFKLDENGNIVPIGDKGDKGDKEPPKVATGGIVRSWGIQHLQTGGLVRYLADGGLVTNEGPYPMFPGRAKGRDTKPAWLEVGEAVLTKVATQHIGADRILDWNAGRWHAKPEYLTDGSTGFLPTGRVIPGRLSDDGWLLDPPQVEDLRAGMTTAPDIVSKIPPHVTNSASDGGSNRGPVTLVLEVDKREIGRVVWDAETMSGANRRNARLQVQQLVTETR